MLLIRAKLGRVKEETGLGSILSETYAMGNLLRNRSAAEQVSEMSSLWTQACLHLLTVS